MSRCFKFTARSCEVLGAPQEQSIGNFNRVVTNLVVRREQRLFPNMEFTCSGNITQWTFVARDTGIEQTTYHPSLQIWRQVDQNSYTNPVHTSLFVSYESKERDNVHVLTLEPPLRVEEGDILGIYQPLNGSVEVLYQESSGPVNLVVENILGTTDGPAPTSVFGLVSISENDWPLVTVEFIREWPL